MGGAHTILSRLARLLGLNTSNNDPEYQAIFPSIQHEKKAAWQLILVAFGIGTIGSVVLHGVGASPGLVISVRVLGLISMSGPLLWLAAQIFYEKARVVLKRKSVVLHQPLRYFDREIPYHQIAIFTVEDDNLALIWHKPRRVAPGDELRPPKPRLITSVALQDAKGCGVALGQALEGVDQPEIYHEWTTSDILRQKRRRALFRRLTLFTILPFVCLFFMIVAARFIFALLGVRS